MGLFSWLKGRPKEAPVPQSKAPETPLSIAKPEVRSQVSTAVAQPKERQRALGPIGCPNISPLPSTALEQLRATEAQALSNGAIAAKWRSSRYYEPYGGTDHPERDHKIYALRDNWAMQKGLMQAGPDGYVDEITVPGEESGCQCQFVYLHALRDLPEAMLTERGRAERQKFEAIWADMKMKHREPKITLGAVRSGKDKS
jgi:hypothetical protein